MVRPTSMSSRLILGPVAFSGFEIPDSIPFSGKQKLHTHELIGAGRVVDAMGFSPHDIRWEGRFRGSNALSRARLLDALTRQGATLPLSWGVLFQFVVIESFDPDYRRPYEIPYRINCRVTGSELGGGLLSGGLASLASLAASDIGKVVSLAGGIR